MAKESRILYQFPISHYCEKTRWNLDAKGLSYKITDIVPGVHAMVLKRQSGVRTVPMLIDRGVAVGDSTKIALHLENVYRETPLLPSESAAKARALELEDYFDKTAGPAVRQWIYGQLMTAEAGSAAAILLGAYPLPVRILGRFAAPYIETSLRKMYRINAEGIAKAYSTIFAVAERLEAETSGDPSRYLVGDSLSLADITAASLLSPVLAPNGSPYNGSTAKVPPAIEDMRAKLAETAAGKWVAARYKSDRNAFPSKVMQS